MSNILGNMPPVFGSGYRGVVPAPTAADVSAQNILRADGTWGAGPSGTLPSQTGNAGELLTTDGTNASWASSLNTFQFGDVTLGASGPSVKSSLSARAPRQGLVFDGTAGATVANVPAFGTSNYSFAVWVLYKTSSSPQALFDSGVNGCVFAIAANGQVLLFDRTASATRAASTTLLTAGKSYFLAYSRTGQIYIDGIANGAVVADGSNYTSTTAFIGKSYANTEFCLGSISNPLIYNRALSASEVVALYEAGAPAGADYPATVAGTDIVTSGNFSSATGWTVGSAWSISGGVATTNGTADAGGATELAQTGKSFKAGQRIRVTFTLGNVSAGGFRIIFYGGSANTLTTIRTASGTYTEEVVLAGSATAFQTIAATPVQLNNGATLDNLSIVPLGLLLAPDAAQAGGGLVWYDTSGNAANITLPASGVSWNVPTSGYVTSGSSLNLSAGGTNQNITLTPSGTGGTVIQSNANNGDVLLKLRATGASPNGAIRWTTNTDTYTVGIGSRFNIADNGLEFLIGSTTTGAALRSNGNFLIGGTIDGGQKLQVSGTASISNALSVGPLAPGVDTASHAFTGIGPNTGWVTRISSIYDANYTDQYITINGTLTGTRASPTFTGASTGGGFIRVNGQTSSLEIGRFSGGAGQTGTTALTLDSSLNATFARQVLAGAGFVLGWSGRGHLIAPSDGVITLLNAASNDFNRLQFGGTTASFPSLKRSTSVLTCVLADDSAFATFRALDFSAQGAATTVGANQVSYGGTTATTATAGAQTLPANPVGFIIVNVAGTTAKIPYYAN